jgi:hypothetical protein
MQNPENYRKRAVECVAFARNARTDDERKQLLTMANTLRRLALERERNAVKTRKSQS